MRRIFFKGEMMNILDLRFSKEKEKSISLWPGHLFKEYRCDPSMFAPVHRLPVGLHIGDRWFLLTEEIREYPRGEDTVKSFTFLMKETEKSKIRSTRPDVVQKDVKIGKEIAAVEIQNEKKTLYKDGKEFCQIYVTKGIRFIFKEGTLTFRKPVYFSDFLNIEDGSPLCKEWEEKDRLPEEWEDRFHAVTEVENIYFDK